MLEVSPTTISDMTTNDTDHDGLTDGQEDFDGDGIWDSNEPNPLDMDSDDDGVLDGADGLSDVDSDGKANCVDPDSDNDGIYDGTEMGLITHITDNFNMNYTTLFIINGTNISKGYFIVDEDPLTTTDFEDNDTDDDGLLDGIEDNDTNGGISFGETDPNDKDSDNDGLADGWIDQMVWNSTSQQFESCSDGTVGEFDQWEGEDKNLNGSIDKDGNGTFLETNPLMNDTDSDLLGDGDETKPELIKEDDVDNSYNYVTNPLISDTDNDGLSDYLEIIGWDVTVRWEATFEIATQSYHISSDPNDNDTDNDGLIDNAEYIQSSDPIKTDTDGDDINDKKEVDLNSNPGYIDGLPPTINNMECWVDPIVKKGSIGIFYLSGIKIKLTFDIIDPCYTNYIDLEINNKLLREFLQEAKLQNTIYNKTININSDFSYFEKNNLFIRLTDYDGNLNISNITPTYYWPNFKEQNWVDPWVYLNMGNYQYPDNPIEIPSSIKNDMKSILKDGIKNLYKSMKNDYMQIYNSFFSSYYDVNTGLFNKKYIDEINNLYKHQYAGFYLNNLIEVFNMDSYSKIKTNLRLLGNCYYTPAYKINYKLDLHDIISRLKADIDLLESTFKYYSKAYTDLTNFIYLKTRQGTLSDYINDQFGWYQNVKSNNHLPRIIEIGYGKYILYKININIDTDRDLDGIHDLDETKILFRPSNSAVNNGYTRGWVSIDIGEDELLNCGYSKTRRFYLTRNYNKYNKLEFIRKGYTWDGYQYLLFMFNKNNKDIYIIFIITNLESTGWADVTVYRSDMTSNNYYTSTIPTGIYYFTEIWLCPKANPIIRDIFVEVDWMWEGVKSYYWKSSITGKLKKYYWIDDLGATSSEKYHAIPQRTNCEIRGYFKRKGFRLHIDDGTNHHYGDNYWKGGGGPVPYADNIREDSTSLRHHGSWDDFNDFFDYQYNYFNYEQREGIYFYALMANLYAKYDDRYKDPYTVLDNYGGISVVGDYHAYFMVFDGSSTNKDAKYKNFMHELGHNILGAQGSATHRGPVYLDEWGHHNVNYCLMEETGKGSNYCSRCWSEFNVASSLKGSYWWLYTPPTPP